MKRPNTINIPISDELDAHEMMEASGTTIEGEGECPECNNDLLEIISNTHYECTCCGYTDLQKNFKYA